jgi:probable pyridine nucleotide-disulfide oxidoreductase
MNYHYDLISIGSGSSGRRVAVALKQAGWKTAIIEKDVTNHFGGTCICTGCIPTKALLEKSLKTNNLEEVKAHKENIVERIRSGTLRHVEERVGLEVIRGEAKFIDNHTIDVAGEKYTSDLIVVATGSKSVIPPVIGLKDVNYKTSEQILKLDKVPKRLLVIGGGRIGLEFATLYHRLGSEVFIFEATNQLLPGEDTEIVKAIDEYLSKLGIKIFKGKFVEEVKEKENNGIKEFEIILEDGSYIGDELLVATGRVPNINKLNLEQIGIKTEKNAIKVNEFMQTSIPSIFAIGDVVGDPMFTNWASFQSGVLLENLKVDRYDNNKWNKLQMPNVPRICFIEPELASTGLTEAEARKRYGDDVVTYNFYNKWLGKSMIVDDWDGILKGIGRKGSNEILGVSLWGNRAGSLVQMFVLAMDNKLGWKELASGVYGHPVLVEGVYSLASAMKNRTKAP